MSCYNNRVTAICHKYILISRAQYQVHAGSLNPSLSRVVKREIGEMIPHPQYKDNTNAYYDLCVVVMNEVI